MASGTRDAPARQMSMQSVNMRLSYSIYDSVSFPAVFSKGSQSALSSQGHRPIIAAFNLLCRFLIYCCFEPRATLVRVWLKNWRQILQFFTPCRNCGNNGREIWVNFSSSALIPALKYFWRGAAWWVDNMPHIAQSFFGPPSLDGSGSCGI